MHCLIALTPYQFDDLTTRPPLCLLPPTIFDCTSPWETREKCQGVLYSASLFTKESTHKERGLIGYQDFFFRKSGNLGGEPFRDPKFFNFRFMDPRSKRVFPVEILHTQTYYCAS